MVILRKALPESSADLREGQQPVGGLRSGRCQAPPAVDFKLGERTAGVWARLDALLPAVYSPVWFWPLLVGVLICKSVQSSRILGGSRWIHTIAVPWRVSWRKTPSLRLARRAVLRQRTGASGITSASAI
jgi:hypothetical protein